MRKLITNTFMTLDGVVQAPGGPEEDQSGQFPFGGWSFPYYCSETEEFGSDLMSEPFDLVLGRKTYDLFAAFWPAAPDAIDAKKPFNEAVKYVASRATPNLSWQNSRQLEGDVVAAIKALKQTDGADLQIHGSADLIQSLLDGGVIDEMRIITHPIVLGTGKRLFGEGLKAVKFTVVKTVTAPNGVIMSIYRPDGEVATGSFADAQ